MRGTCSVGIMFVTVIFLSGCATPRHGSSFTPPHERFQGYDICYVKPFSVTPPYDKIRTVSLGVRRLRQEVTDHLRWVFPRLASISDETEIVGSPARALVISPVIERMIYVNKRHTPAGGFRGSTFVQMRLEFRDVETGVTIARPTFFRRANTVSGVFSWGATDHLVMSRIAWDVFDYVTLGKVPDAAIPPGMDARSADPSMAYLLQTVPIVPKPGQVAPGKGEQVATTGVVMNVGAVADVEEDSPVQLHSQYGQLSQADLVQVAILDRSRQVRIDALSRLTDQAGIGEVAQRARDSAIRLRAVQKLSDQTILESIAARDRNVAVRLAAVERLTTPSALERIAATGGNWDVSEAARSRLVMMGL